MKRIFPVTPEETDYYIESTSSYLKTSKELEEFSLSFTLYLRDQFEGFPGGSDGKESACNAGDLGLLSGLGRFPWRRAFIWKQMFSRMFYSLSNTTKADHSSGYLY